MGSKVIVGRYELLEKIGDGGMAVVCKAKDRLLNRAVAVKILKPEYTNDDKFINNFRKESHAAASLSHPNIVSIYDVGKEGNINYIVMELVEGMPLSRLIKQRAPLDYNTVIDYSKQIAAGLAAAHKHGIIHRDVKPHNILVNEDGVCKIADFGIAKAISTTTIVDGTSETIMGSVHYFSPEQARGGYVDEKSDIYSLGIVMYEMLTGQVPFDADNPVSVALMHINEPITPPSKLVDGIPPGLEKIVMKATDKFQSNRFKSAEELIEALDDIDLVSRVVGNSVFMGSEQKPNVKPVQSDPYIYDEEEVQLPRETVPPAVAAAKKRRKRRIITALLVIAAVVAGLAIAAHSLGIIGKANIEVPDFKGRTVEEAEKIAEAKELDVDIVKYEVSDEYKTGEVMDQNPPAGEKVKKNTTIELTVSKGSDEGVVPNVIGLSEKDAKKLLKDSEYDVEVRVVTAPQTKGIVVNQSPGAGETAKKGDTVTIEVSDGEGKEEGEVPSLIGMSESDAKAAITNAGFEVGNISEETNGDYKAGQVIDQEYPAGTTLEKGKSIGFTISKGAGSSTVQLYIDYADAVNDVFYLTVTVSDDDGTRNVISNAQRQKEKEGETLKIKGTGKGTITVVFDNDTVMRRNVDFETGELS